MNLYTYPQNSSCTYNMLARESLSKETAEYISKSDYPLPLLFMTMGLKTELTLFSLESEKHQMHKVHTCRLLLTSFLDSEWGECGKPMFHFSFAYTGLCKTTKKRLT